MPSVAGNTSDKDNSAGKENIIYSGTMITKGTARAKVIATGVNAQMGKISDMLTDIEDEETPCKSASESWERSLRSSA